MVLLHSIKSVPIGMFDDGAVEYRDSLE